MMTAHEIIGFMSPALADHILQQIESIDKQLYRGTMSSLAEARKLRPVFLERKPRPERHADMIAQLSKPRHDELAGNLLRIWLMKSQAAMLTEFLDSLGIKHENGAVEDLPETIEDDRLKQAIDQLLSNHEPEKVAVYLQAFNSMNDVQWPFLTGMLEKDERWQLGG
jgi:hypothetical protein